MPLDAATREFALRGSHLTRPQVGAIPVRWLESGPEVLLVTTRGGSRWIVPKGWPLAGCPNREAAQREAFEEAGVIGSIAADALGWFEYWKRIGAKRAYFRAQAFALRVEEVLPDWPERQSRKRCWFKPEVAAAMVANEALAALLIEAAYEIGDRN